MLSLLGLISACSDDETFSDKSYPTKITALPEKSLDGLYASIEQTPIYNCTQLNSFGYFLFDMKGNDACSITPDFRADFAKEELILMAKQILLEYGKFTNVRDTSLLQTPVVSAYSGQLYDKFVESFPDSLPRAWYVSFGTQNYGGMEIRGTVLRVLIGPVGELAIHGNWYETVYIPNSDAITEEMARHSTYGKTFTYGTYSVIPSETSVWYDSKKIIVPIKKGNSIELRVCWAVYPNNWEILVDSQSGSTVSVSRLLEN